MRLIGAKLALTLLISLGWIVREPVAQDPVSPTAKPDAGPTATTPGSPPATPRSAEERAARQRFDKLVRVDLFDGFAGDEAALSRGLETCEAALKTNPDHAEALVWRGAVAVFRSAALFGKGSMVSGMKLWNAGLDDMDRAVRLEPNNPGVRIPRAAVLLPAARNAPKWMGAPLLDRALEDYQTMTRLQKDKITQLGEHPWGELRMGLADVYRLRGDIPSSRAQLELLLSERPDTAYGQRAKTWLAAPAEAKLVHNCIGCHGG